MKREWDRTLLTVNFWHGPAPQVGDGLRTRTGRQYLILRPINRRNGSLRALECMVLPKAEPIPGTVFAWEWSPRGRRRR